MESEYTISSQQCTGRGQIYKAIRNSDQKKVVIKKVCYGSIDPKEKQQIVDEVNILSELKNNHVVGYYKHHLNKATAELRIVMEYCEGGSLASFISTFRQEKRRIPEEAIWKTFTQLVIALLCIHPSSILHRNIKPSNIFLDADRNVKLGDFAFARRLDPEELFSATVLPTTNYMSPEQVKTGIFSKKTDIWALGCLLYEMCTLQPPFLGENEFETARLIRDCKPKKIPYSPELNRAVFWCLEKRPEQRPTVEDLKGIPEINLRIRQKRFQELYLAIKKREAVVERKENEFFELQEKMKLGLREGERQKMEEKDQKRNKEKVKQDRKESYEGRQLRVDLQGYESKRSCLLPTRLLPYDCNVTRNLYG